MLPTIVQSASRSSASSSSPPRAWQSAGGSRCRRARRDGAECVVRVRLGVEAEELVALERRAVVRLPASRASQIAGWIAQRRSARRDRVEDERRRSPRATSEVQGLPMLLSTSRIESISSAQRRSLTLRSFLARGVCQGGSTKGARCAVGRRVSTHNNEQMDPLRSDITI